MQQLPKPSTKIQLEVARAYIAEHGFSPYLRYWYESDGPTCFLGALVRTGLTSIPLGSPCEQLLRHYICLHSTFPDSDRAFGSSYLQTNGFDTAKALAVFDAAIATVENEIAA